MPRPAFSESQPTSVVRGPLPQVEPRAVVVLAVDPSEVARYPANGYTVVAVKTTAEGLECIFRMRPRVVAVDWDLATLNGGELCRSARRIGTASILIATSAPAQAPAALKAGCDAVLLKPFPPNLAAARIGRLCRERPGVSSGALLPHSSCGSNRMWADTACPRCAAAGAVSFEYSSYRRMWYACLSCEHVWLGPRRE